MRPHIVKSKIKYLLVGLATRIFTPDSAPRLVTGQPQTKAYTLSAMIRVKNEARFLPELLAYHRLLGVEHFHIYDNNSTDNLQAALQPFLERGWVTIIPWPTVPASPSCYVDFWQNHAGKSEWVAFLDADEFIVEGEEGLLRKTLAENAKKYPALALNWWYYGAAGHNTLPDGLVIENFRRRAPAINTHVKVIVQPSRVYALFNSHNFFYRHFRLARSVSGARVFGSHTAEANDIPLRINHYLCRSRENVIAKSTHGYVDKQGYIQKSRTLDTVERALASNNEMQDDSLALSKGPKVRVLLTELGYAAPYLPAAAA